MNINISIPEALAEKFEKEFNEKLPVEYPFPVIREKSVSVDFMFYIDSQYKANKLIKFIEEFKLNNK
jgi:hypothetical protein